MRIVIDMQGAQSSGSWNRGIGRYTMSLALAMARNRGANELFLALNGAFPESIERIRARFGGVLPQDNIRVWHAHAPMAYVPSENEWRRRSGELVREAFLASLRPDVVLISSLFEGHVDDAVTSVKRFAEQPITAVILYDLIPYIHRRPYLENAIVESWYLEKINHLRRSDLCLAISECSRQEGIELLSFSSERCINISTDADSQFGSITISSETEGCLRERYGLTRRFVMYTGGIDHRKNIEALIRSYARLSPELRNSHQLAIICSVRDDIRHRLSALAKDAGLTTDEVILTGFVPEEDLIALYNLCAVFVFPSWYEGFGLPVLEAMRCGAPVIASNVSSLPEVVGLEEALFDPRSEKEIARAIERVLIDSVYRERLVLHGKEQAKKFSWDASAQRAIASMERAVADLRAPRSPRITQSSRPRLAYVSPLPPERSGISDYSAELLPVLAQHYEIEVVVAQSCVSDTWVTRNCPVRTVGWFLENGDCFDRVLYHFGNSAFHHYMFELLKKIPGVVVLHDFYLSGVLHHMDSLGYSPGCFAKALYKSHGYKGLLDRSQVSDIDEVIWKYPCSREVLEGSLGTIFHSESGIRLSESWYGEDVHDRCVVPLVRVAAEVAKANKAREILDIPEDELVVCSFGVLEPTKLNLRLLKAWFASSLAKSGKCRLVFVGEHHGGHDGSELLSLIERHPLGASVFITGRVEQQEYRQYLSAADLGVQLHTLSQGEAYASVLDCMNHGLATIVIANGGMADLGDDVVWKLADGFDDQDLIEALETLWRDHNRRKAIGERAKALIAEKHDPARCAVLYKNAIENFYAKNPNILKKLIESIAVDSAPDRELMSLAHAIARSLPQTSEARQLLVDVSELVLRDARTTIHRVVRSVLQHWLNDPPVGWRIEPVYATQGEPYRYARTFTTGLLGITDVIFDDDPVDFRSGDVFFALDYAPQIHEKNADFYLQLRTIGVTVKFMVYDLRCISKPEHFLPGAADGFSRWLRVVGESDGAICISQTVADELLGWMDAGEWRRLRPFNIDVNPLDADSERTCRLTWSESTNRLAKLLIASAA